MKPRKPLPNLIYKHFMPQDAAVFNLEIYPAHAWATLVSKLWQDHVIGASVAYAITRCVEDQINET